MSKDRFVSLDPSLIEVLGDILNNPLFSLDRESIALTLIQYLVSQGVNGQVSIEALTQVIESNSLSGQAELATMQAMREIKKKKNPIKEIFTTNPYMLSNLRLISYKFDDDLPVVGFNRGGQEDIYSIENIGIKNEDIWSSYHFIVMGNRVRGGVESIAQVLRQVIGFDTYCLLAIESDWMPSFEIMVKNAGGVLESVPELVTQYGGNFSRGIQTRTHNLFDPQKKSLSIEPQINGIFRVTGKPR
jgi:hypothetical protein